MNKDRRFSAREARSLLWLLPLLAVASWLVWMATNNHSLTGPDDAARNFGQSGAYATLGPETEAGAYQAYVTDSVSGLAAADVPLSPKLFRFDPNTVDYHDLVRLGFERGEALGIIKYRERGKVFEIPEDFAACYQVTEAMYRRLEPYITIGERFRLKPFAARPTGQTERGQLSSYENRSTLAEGEGEVARAPETLSERRPPVDLNTADSAALIAVSGIGPATVTRIIDYRTRLGGFHDVAQLAEVRGVSEQNFELMVREIFVDPAVIQKIDINFAPAKALAEHPYIEAAALRKLLRNRQLKGGWRTPEELEADDIFTREELTRLGPYLIFNDF